jgi:putative Holliday junction resolvase
LSRILALDYGSARCGCALSDFTGTLATPIETVREPLSEEGLGRIARIVAEHEVETVVVGLPVSLSGGEGHQAEEARAFAEHLRRTVQVPVETYDERFTSKLARKSGGRASEDSRAAAHLLSDYLRSRSGEAGR